MTPPRSRRTPPVRSPRVAFAALFGVAALLLAGCGGGSAGGGSGAASTTLRMAWQLPPMPFDPHTTVSTIGAFPYLSLVYDRLTQIAPGPAGPVVAPMLATGWEQSPDGRTVTFTLRDDAVFHDGTPVDATAVRDTLRRAATLPGSTVAGDRRVVQDVQAPDPRTVVLSLSRPATDVLFTLATSVGSVLSPAALRGEVDPATTDAGSGPYRLGELKLGDRVVYERAEGYWDPAAQQSSRIEILGIPDDNARLNALRSGQVDAIMAKVTQQEQAEQLAADGRFTVVTERPTSWYAMYLDTALAPLDDVRVRRALNYAVDREAIDAAVFDGNCAPTSQPLQEGVVGHAPAVGYTHDRQRARELLAEAGLGGGVTLTAVTSGVSASQLALAQVLQAQLGEVGIRLDVRGMDFTQAVADFRDRKAHGFIGSHPGVADPGMTVSDAYLSAFFPGPLPEGYEDLLARAADSTKPADERRALLEAASATASEHALDLYLCGYSASFVSTPDITGFDAMTAPDQGGPFDLRYVGRAEAS
jgi:ABC-type transport system substrate-binding protein